MIRDAYKYAAGQDAFGNSLGIGQITLTRTMQQCENLIDGKTLEIKDIDLGMVAVKAKD
jgi:hypothetical protein